MAGLNQNKKKWICSSFSNIKTNIKMGKLQDFQKEKIKEIISDLSGFSEEQINDETLLKDGIGLDSLDVVEMFMKFEEEFDCNIPDEDYEHVKTVNDVFKIVENRIS